jgi:hypothetical protein
VGKKVRGFMEKNSFEEKFTILDRKYVGVLRTRNKKYDSKLFK